jgi:hypothetical protein
MFAEASTVMRAVAADFFCNCWYLEIPSDNRIRHVPKCVNYHAQRLRLELGYYYYYYYYYYYLNCKFCFTQ